MALILYLAQEKLIFQGQSLPADYKFRFDRPFQEGNLVMEDGASINYLHFTSPESNGLIVYYHGNAGSLAGWGYVAEDLRTLGYDVAIMDYRGYGKSFGELSQKSILSDAVSFYQHFKTQYSEDKMILYGRSLGSGISAYVASLHDPSMIILESPYFSFTSLVQNHFPLFPAGPALRYKFRTKDYLKSVECPIYIFHGTEDRIVPIEHGERLIESLSDKKSMQMTVINGGSHNDLDSYEEYWTYLENALKNPSVDRALE